jgi:hypothetical protein
VESRVLQQHGSVDEIEPRVLDDAAIAEVAAPEPPRALRVALGAFAALCVATVLIHVVMVFLHVAPSNPISQRFTKQIDAWVYPYFEQNWRLFAPNPAHEKVQIFARTGWKSASGAKQTSDWFDISAVDKAALRHNPFPSHVTQNMLDKAWDAYQDTHNDDSDDVSYEAALIRQDYLRNIAVQRVAAHSPHPFQVIQLKVVTRQIAPPEADDKTTTDSTDPDIWTLLWWKVTPDGN